MNKISELIDISNYDQQDVELSGSNFTILGRKSGGFGLEKLLNSFNRMAPELLTYLNCKIETAAIIDFEAPLGGGPLSNFIIGIFSSINISDEHKSLIKRSTGWSEKASTLDYIEENYSEFNNSTEAYIDDMLVHELGHLFFGFGLTTLPTKEYDEDWLAFGLGCVYDRLVWSKIYEIDSPLFSGVNKQWKEVYNFNENIDHKLINPNTENDEKEGLERKQVFGHGKSFYYLSELRKRVGGVYFDLKINQFIKRENDHELCYEQLVGSFDTNSKDIILALESEYKVR